MSTSVPVCRAIKVVAFHGDRSRAFAASFLRSLDDERNGRGTGPTVVDCLLFAGHTVVSTDGGTIIYGFNPERGHNSIWQLMDRLKSGAAFAGVVSDDTAIFSEAAQHGLTILAFEVILPDPSFQDFVRRLDGERKKSQYTYGFPNGDGDCNCITWLVLPCSSTVMWDGFSIRPDGLKNRPTGHSLQLQWTTSASLQLNCDVGRIFNPSGRFEKPSHGPRTSAAMDH